MNRNSLEYLFVLAVPLLAGISCVAGPTLLGVRHTGLIWPLMLVSGGSLMLLQRERTVFPWQIWFPWYAMMTLSFLWSERMPQPNLQFALQLLTPPIAAFIAGCVRFDQRMLDQLFKAFCYCLVMIGVAFVFFQYGPGAPYQQAHQEDGGGFTSRSASLTLCVVASVFVARARQMPLLSLIGWLVCFAITLLSGSRTASAAMLLLFCVVPRYQRVFARPAAISAMVLAGMIAFATPIMQQRFFGEEGGSLSDVSASSYSTAGRSTAWPLIWQEALKHPIVGHGVGSSVFIVEPIWPGIDKPHNDYLRIVCEAGFIGLAFFVFALIWQLTDLWRIARNDTEARNWPATAAFLSLCSLAIIAVTDNPIVYGLWYMNPIFVLIGIAYSVQYRPQFEPIFLDSDREADTIRDTDETSSESAGEQHDSLTQEISS